MIMQIHKAPLMLNLNIFTHYIYIYYTKKLKYLTISIIIKSNFDGFNQWRGKKIAQTNK
jgi:hypothetical protein